MDPWAQNEQTICALHLSVNQGLIRVRGSLVSEITKAEFRDLKWMRNDLNVKGIVNLQNRRFYMENL